MGSYGSAGNGTVFELIAELFKSSVGITPVLVSYRGSAPTRSAPPANAVPVAFETVLPLQPHVKAG